jgi:tetratricopeptide (TPR) repeat protein
MELAEQFDKCMEEAREPGVEACRRALALGLPPDRAATVHVVLAVGLAGLERWDEVVETYRGLLELEPKDPEAHLRLGMALLHAAGEPEEALPYLEYALREHPEARAHGAMGSALNLLGRHREAVEAFEHALALDPSYFEFRPTARQVLELSRRGEVWPPRE